METAGLVCDISVMTVIVTVTVIVMTAMVLLHMQRQAEKVRCRLNTHWGDPMLTPAQHVDPSQQHVDPTHTLTLTHTHTYVHIQTQVHLGLQ